MKLHKGGIFKMSRNADFCGWATKYNVRCSDGRTILHGAFAAVNNKRVPLVWNHNHKSVDQVLGYADLEECDDGVKAYGYFNDTPSGRSAKSSVEHGDISSLSICANHLNERLSNVMSGDIKEVSLVIAGANPGAFIEDVAFAHGDDEGYEAIIYSGEPLLLHADDDDTDDTDDTDETPSESPKKESKKMAEEKTIQDVIDSMTDEQRNVLYALVGSAIADTQEQNNNSKGDNKEMKHNLFDDDNTSHGVLTHADKAEIIRLAKQTSVGSLQSAINLYVEEDSTLEHNFDSETMGSFFPEFKDVNPTPPELIMQDQGWVGSVINGAHKSPFSRIRTKQVDIRNAKTSNGFRGKGYVKGNEKKNLGNAKLIARTTDPQTIYVKDKLNRDDIVDITDFNIVDYQYKIMRSVLNEEVATAILIGDGREDGTEGKISEDHVRSIWKDDDLYTIHQDVDFNAVKDEIQGSDTSKHFGDNYIYAEAIVQYALYAREDYKGTGTPIFYCTPHLLNIMLLARDLNGRRIYENKSDLQAALNVSDIQTVEQFEGQTRNVVVNGVERTKKLLGIFVNMADYQLGATKGGEITTFKDFDIDFNQEKYLMETRLSGALRNVYSAIALEEDVTGNF